MLTSFISKHLDLLVGFGGNETMPHDVQPFVNGLVEKIATNGVQKEDLWKLVEETLISFPTTVTTNTVIVAFATEDGFVARQIGMHRAERPLGCFFPKCGLVSCKSKDRPGHIIGELRDGSSARIRCKCCGWKSNWVRLESQAYISHLQKTRAPLLFYHAFPSPAGLLSMFF